MPTDASADPVTLPGAEQLSLRERAGQLVMARLGSNMPPPVAAADDAQRMADLLARCPLGGLILFNGHVETTPHVLADLQAQGRAQECVPLLVATDMERGVGQQIAGATVFPHARAFGAVEENAEALVEQAARAAAREALACGIHITFAPVADVNLDPRNPIIATRAFADEPARAARLAAAHVRGCRAEGLLSTAKHFPGHGRTSADSHAELPVIRATRQELEAEEFVPFRAAIDAGAELVMTAHVAVPALDASGAPATCSRPVLTGALRHVLGFGGAVITDSLLMAAIRERFDDAGAQAAALLEAGVDVLLDPLDPQAMVDGIVREVEAGRLPAARVDEAARRVLALKRQMVRRHGRGAFAPAARAAPDAADWEAHRRLAEHVARQAITVEEAAPGHVLPLDVGAPLLVVRMISRASDGSALEAAMRRAFRHVRYVEVGPEPRAEAVEAAREGASTAEAVVLALAVEPAAWHRFGLRPAQRELARVLAAHPRLVAAALGSPHVLADVPSAAARLCTYSDVPAAQRALAHVLSAGRTAG